MGAPENRDTSLSVQKKLEEFASNLIQRMNCANDKPVLALTTWLVEIKGVTRSP